MSRKRKYLVMPLRSGWVVRREESDSVYSMHWSEEDAIDAGRQRAYEERTELVIHRRDGSVDAIGEPLGSGFERDVESERLERFERGIESESER